MTVEEYWHEEEKVFHTFNPHHSREARQSRWWRSNAGHRHL